MTPADISETPQYDTSIRLLDHLPDDLVDDAAALYLSALADKLIPVYGAGPRARRALACGFNRPMCITAMEKDRLVGILGIQTAAAGFMDVTVNTLQPFYGTLGSLWRMALLVFLNHSPMADEAYIDGVVVSPSYRGRGVGSGLIAALEAWATGQGLSIVCLEVVDANPRAENLYRRIGFETVREQTVWPVGTLFGFRSSTVMVKVLT
ncbi:GNAT family N-acetyltransferase [Desulfosarcina sp.]|uniref:GNAT family N-acetyltransferase n=1 Tax=Desulfosarcina sp. TaxID=2027861 RepID=UPI0029A404EC|nr:GNAT family N-acetyltransferase [Desulfosarcina sp.]MDX2452766.1 GNAT family N-acetyltransferase [Desulfosarcina sp.]MDX2490517.1 GNAT family N-acetyltransferase [Desulfosarcina sp.]